MREVCVEGVGELKPPGVRPLTITGVLTLLLCCPFGLGWGLFFSILVGSRVMSYLPINELAHYACEALVPAGFLLNLSLAYLCLRKRRDLALGLFCFVIPALLVVAAMPPYVRQKSAWNIGFCKSNLLSTAAALGTYAEDNAGLFPPSFESLTPRYLPALPKCPTADDVTYAYAHNIPSSAYTLVCAGRYHTSAGIHSANYPQYSSYSGLILP